MLLISDGIKLVPLLKSTSSDLPDIGTPLADFSWSKISEISRSGNASKYFRVGDRKSIILNGKVGVADYTNVPLNVYVLDFDYNDNKGIIFGCFLTNEGAICLDTNWNKADDSGFKYFNMTHWSASNYGGWSGCDLRYDILGSTDTPPDNYGSAITNEGRAGHNPTSECTTKPVPDTLMSSLPEDLRSVMKPMTVYTDNVGGGSTEASNVTSTIDYLPLLAEYEVFGVITHANPNEAEYQKQLEYWKFNSPSCIRYSLLARKEAGTTWNRSPSVTLRNGLVDKSFNARSNLGTSGTYESNYSVGLSPMFLI